MCFMWVNINDIKVLRWCIFVLFMGEILLVHVLLLLYLILHGILYVIYSWNKSRTAYSLKSLFIILFKNKCCVFIGIINQLLLNSLRNLSKVKYETER